ncbi:unnamed protein product [Linum trigynum]|uniref:Uncharacterized protein n=1 Tax=Linum trigynum TaxID=586398 RepID=A0AAV2CRG8_9ROSI
MKNRDSVPLLLVLLLLVSSGILLLPCYASELSSSANDTQAHRHPPAKALHLEADHDEMGEGGERLKETERKGGKGGAGKGAYGGADVLRQPNQRRSGGGDSAMFRSMSSLFPSAGGMMMIMMVLFLGFS